MSHFLQLHYLTIYPPSNPNRDDQGHPKSVFYGGTPRLRISSQALKRAARLSNVMQTDLAGHLGERTQRIGEIVRDKLIADGADEEKAKNLATAIADVFGKLDKKAEKNGKIHTRQLAFISPDERECAIEIARKTLNGEPMPEIKDLKEEVLRTADGAADIAMFGRMLADDPDYNREAAVQVSHAFTTHQSLIEDDFYTAVDDLKQSSEDAGAGFIGEAGFGSGVFYTYACLDTELLIENLSGDAELASRAAGALAEALATSTPSGKRNSFGHQTFASYILAEYGSKQPRSLAGAFFKPIQGDDLLAASIEALGASIDQMNEAYGPCAERHQVMNVPHKQGSLEEIKSFAVQCISND